MKNVSGWAARWVEPEPEETYEAPRDEPRNVTPGRVQHDDAWLNRKVTAFREDALARSVDAGRASKRAALATALLTVGYCANVPIVSGLCFLGALYSGAIAVFGWSEWRTARQQAAIDCTYEDD